MTNSRVMNRLLVTAAATAVLLLPAVASASTILDDFSVNQQANDAPGATGPTTTVGIRTFTVDNGAATAPSATTLQSGFSPDYLDFSNASGVTGTGEVSWALMGANLSSYTGFEIDLVRYDLNNATTDLTLSVDGSSAMSRLLSASAVGTLAFNFSEFAGANFGSINNIVLTLDNSTLPSVDLALDDFRAVGELMPVPLPAGGLLLVTGLLGLGVLRRRTA